MRASTLGACVLVGFAACRSGSRATYDEPARAKNSSRLVLPSGGLSLQSIAANVPKSDKATPHQRVQRSFGLERALIGEWEVDAHRGVIGVRPPRSTLAQIGLDDRDALCEAGPTPTLFRMSREDRDRVRSKAVTNLGIQRSVVARFPPGDDLRSAAVAGPVVAIPSGNTVFVSFDRGDRFQRSTPLALAHVEAIHPRADGVLVAVGDVNNERRVMLSNDRGKTWVRSRYEPAEIFSLGAIIWNADPRCPAILSNNGIDWVGLPEVEPSLKRLRELAWDPLVVGSRDIRVLSASALMTFEDPPAPPAPASQMDRPRCVNDEVSLGLEEPSTPMSGLLLPAVEGRKGFIPARFTTGLVEAPTSCRSGHLVGTGSRIVLVCGTPNGSSLHVVTPLDISNHEQALRFRPLGALPHLPEVIADVPLPHDPEGRFFLHHRSCVVRGPCRASVVDLNGSAKELIVDGARVYWPDVHGGAIAVVVETTTEAFRVDFVRIEANLATRKWVSVQGRGSLDDVRTSEDGTVVVTTVRAGEKMHWTVTTNGELVPIGVR